MSTKTKDGFLGPAGALLGGLVGGALGGPAGALAGSGLGGAVGNAVDPADNDSSAPKFASTTGKVAVPDCEGMSTAEIKDWRAQQGLAREA